MPSPGRISDDVSDISDGPLKNIIIHLNEKYFNKYTICILHMKRIMCIQTNKINITCTCIV